VFRFRLERVRRWRQRLADQEARKLQAILARQYRLEREQEEIRQQCRQAAAGAVAADGKSLDLHRARMVAEYLQARQARIQQLEQQRREVLREAAAQRERLREARRRREILDRLRERRREEWEYEQRRREQKDMDEIAGRYVRRQK